MGPQADTINKSMVRLSDEELLKVLTTAAADYTPEALTAAQQEAERRGGLIATAGGRVQAGEARARAQVEAQRARVREDAEVRRAYGYGHHLLAVAGRWYRVYGLLAIGSVVLRYREPLLPLAVLTLLFVVQASVWAGLTYRRTVRESRLLTCSHCGTTLILNLRVLQEQSEEAGHQQLCAACGQALAENVDALARQTEHS